MNACVTRRDLALGAVAAAGAARAKAAPQDRIRVGFVGVGNRGGQLLNATLPNKDVEVAALCDVYEPFLDQWKARLGGGVHTYRDFRHLLERKDLDAVFIATPDHWHAIQMIEACQAGKDVYVEKPLSITIHEGRRMVEAVRRTGRVVQVGLQRRSSELFARIRRLVQDDGIGKVTVARAYRLNNMWPSGIGKPPDTPPPPGLDWDLWLGPRPKRPFNPAIAPYKFRWWQAYSSQMANWGVHYFDVIRWILGEDAPASVTMHGGRFAVDDLRDIPDTAEACFEFASGRLLVFGQYEASGAPIFPAGELELRGTRGALYADDRAFEIVPERGGQFQDPAPRMRPVRGRASDTSIEAQHVRNFLDCVKSRATPNCPVEEGHRSTTFALLANISLATRSRLEWDASTERITNNRAANDLLHYRYRAPWRLA